MICADPPVVWHVLSRYLTLYLRQSHLTSSFVLHSKLLSAPSFVPRSHGVVSPLPKNVVASQVYGSSSSRSNIKMMPIGVPKVAYRVPGSQQADWYDTLFYLS